MMSLYWWVTALRHRSDLCNSGGTLPGVVCPRHVFCSSSKSGVIDCFMPSDGTERLSLMRQRVCSACTYCWPQASRRRYYETL